MKPDEHSVSESLLKKLQESGVYQKGGYMKPDLLYDAICEGLIDLDSLIQAIK